MLKFRHIRLRRIMEPRANVFAFQRRVMPSPALSDEMVISDSEPERERERQRLRRANGHPRSTTQFRQPKQPVQPRQHKVIAQGDIIEISDDSTMSDSNGSIIVLTDTEQSQSVEASQRRVTTFYDAQSEMTNRNITVRKARQSPRNPIVEESSESESSKTDLRQYSYKGIPPKRSHTTPAAALPLAITDKPPVRRYHTDTFSYTDAELRRLSRCPACSLAWTTRKTVPHKLDHIRSCKRKNNLSDDEIKKRISEYLHQTPLDQGSGSGSASKSKGKGKKRNSEVADGEESLPKTLLDDTVKIAEPKKPGRRKAAVTTVVSIEQQHENMNARARNLLSSFNDDDQDFSSNNIGRDGSRSASPHIPLTQAFPASKLGTTPTMDFNGHSHSYPPTLMSDDDRYELFPSNDSRQDFYRRNASMRQFSASPTISSPSQSIRGFLPSQPDYSQTLRTDSENDIPQDTEDYMCNEWQGDMSPDDQELIEAMERWYPGDGGRDCRQSDVLGTHMANIPPDRRERPSTSKSTSDDLQKLLDEDPKLQKSNSKTPKKPSPANTTDMTKTPKTPAKRYQPKRLDQKSQKEFDEFLTAAIESEPSLYLRLLRYEPVDINDIYPLIGVTTGDPGNTGAGGSGEIKLTPKLQRNLRDFLDRKGIVYYDRAARKR